MFKGLRSKIESEQKGQSNIKNLHVPQSTASASTTNTNSNISPYQTSSSQRAQVDQSKSPTTTTTTTIRIPLTKENKLDTAKIDHASVISNSADSRSGQLQGQKLKLSNQLDKGDNKSQMDGEDPLKTVEQLRDEIAALNDQLRSVIKEKDESNDQNAQLYQLIEKLRRNLDAEKEISTSLQTKLGELETALKEKNELVESLKIKSIARFSIKPSNESSTGDTQQSLDNIDSLRLRVIELQNQDSGKSRQLKIKQQNINDLKKALQREMIEHGKTQNELTKVQYQLKQQQIQNNNTHNDCVTLQNGSVPSDLCDANLRLSLNPILSDKPQLEGRQSSASLDGSGLREEMEPAQGVGTQMDGVSCLSRSSASVDDFNSNDLQQGNCSKEVNHEYLRNVLFRYMTSTDTETAQHLIKALSVLMNFSPEQSAAIKSAMNSRSSWLRLTK